MQRTLTLEDPPLAKAISALVRRRRVDDRLLAYRLRSDWRELHAEEVNERFRELVGEDFSVKDLRTWTANVLAAAILAAMPAPTSKRATARAIAQMYREVAEHLGNTPAVAKKSYVDPRLVELFERGATIDSTLASADLTRADLRDLVERATHDLLSKQE